MFANTHFCTAMKVPALIIMLLCTVVVTHAQEKLPEGFVLVRKDGTISMYERWVIFPESNPPQEAREVKGEFIVSSSIYKIIAIMKDEKTIKIWQTHVSEFKVYLQPDSTFWLEYSYHDIPWPVSDRIIFWNTNSTKKYLDKNYSSLSNHAPTPCWPPNTMG